MEYFFNYQNYWFDSNNNRNYVTDTVTKEQALEDLKSLIHCKNCVNCFNCYDCNACNGCRNCISCYICENCNQCKNCVLERKKINYTKY